MDKISVIVPIYNVEKYLNKCIDSIVNQTYKNLEIILIDDGSTDGSGDICDEYAGRDMRIKVFHQENKGVVAARKVGIKNATGEYIGFVDGDDYIDSNMFAELYHLINKKEADIVSSGWKREYRGSEAVLYDNFQEGVYDCNTSNYFFERFMCFEIYENQGINGSLCTKLFKKDLIKSNYLRISDDIRMCEDAALVYMCCMDANKIYITHNGYYHYQMRMESCMHNSKKNYLGIIAAWNECVNTKIEEIDESKERKDILYEQMNKFVQRHLVLGMGKYFEMRDCNRLPIYMNDFSDLIGKNIVIYGAGDVGNSYYRQIKKLKNIKLVLWVDSNKELVKENAFLSDVQDIYNVEFDYIIIAVKYQKLAESISQSLCGIDKKKIIWKKPVFILDYYD